MIHHQIEQNTAEWHEIRRGKFTASIASDLFMGKSTIGFRNVINNIVSQIYTGEVEATYQNADMERGHEWEEVAKERYALQTFREVTPAGFWEYNKFIGASPDGLVDSDGQLEVKSHKNVIMVDVLEKRVSPLFDKWQIQHQLLCTGRKWCDFIAFNPAFPSLVIRVNRDEAMIAELLAKINECIILVENKLTTIRAYK